MLHWLGSLLTVPCRCKSESVCCASKLPCFSRGCCAAACELWQMAPLGVTTSPRTQRAFARLRGRLQMHMPRLGCLARLVLWLLPWTLRSPFFILQTWCGLLHGLSCKPHTACA